MCKEDLDYAEVCTLATAANRLIEVGNSVDCKRVVPDCVFNAMQKCDDVKVRSQRRHPHGDVTQASCADAIAAQCTAGQFRRLLPHAEVDSDLHL
jgi:hypothetical protein